MSVVYSSSGGGGAGGDISGVVSIVSAADADLTAAPTADFVPGEAIVKFRPGVRAQALGGLRAVRDLGLKEAGLYVAMAGNGASDADALLEAHVGIATRSGSGAARDEAATIHWHVSSFWFCIGQGESRPPCRRCA